MLERLQTHPSKGNDGHSLPLEPCFIIVAAPPLICVLESVTGFLPCPAVLPLTKVLTSTSVLTHVHFVLMDARVLNFGHHSSPVTICLLLDCWLLATWAWPAASAAGWKRAGGTIWMSLLELCFFFWKQNFRFLTWEANIFSPQEHWPSAPQLPAWPTFSAGLLWPPKRRGSELITHLTVLPYPNKILSVVTLHNSL